MNDLNIDMQKDQWRRNKNWKSARNVKMYCQLHVIWPNIWKCILEEGQTKKRKVKVKVSKTSPNLIKCMECKKVSPVTRDLTKHLTTHTGGRTDEKRKVIIIYLGLQKWWEVFTSCSSTWMNWPSGSSVRNVWLAFISLWLPSIPWLEKKMKK